nr:immunoglobulin heavy chain junction region [Macaca mulatta]MOX03649.1 immunoglobulin heavy chain junction region [Macaca mulatta]MOX03806.1 immunoglobulin heavy chain junction region [Macaca mulatta]MOX03838.1 immunoglobulin heavy chain junction region [Macaca mulatta]MOX04421.1 immunoglobulin heavy chain junction region [Macaca mulatta]
CTRAELEQPSGFDVW